MGISFSSGRRNHNPHHHYHHHHHHHHPPPPPPYFYPSFSGDPSFILPPPANNHSYYQYQQYTQPHVQPNYYCPGWNNSMNYANSLMGRSNYMINYQMGAPVNEQVPPLFVEHQNAKVVKNDVNVHKDTIRLEVDEHNPDCYLVSFVFDAHFDGSITIYYFGKEEDESCKFSPEYPEVYRPVRIPFRKGLGQRFRQPSGTGIDLGFFELEALGKPSEDDVFPLVIYAEVCSSSLVANDKEREPLPETSLRVQVTQAVIEKKSDAPFQVKVIRQILWIDGVRYEVHELFGIGNSSEQRFNDDDPGKACVICMTEPKNTAVMPCRHLCMCSDCAKELRLQSNKCPICRQPLTELIEININHTAH